MGYTRDFTTIDRMRSAATRAGLDPDDYVRQRRAGRKWCYHCRQFLPPDEFSLNRTQPDGLQSICRECKRTVNREQTQRLRRRREMHRSGGRA